MFVAPSQSKTPDQNSLVEKNVTKGEKGVFELQLSGTGGPLYFALLNEEDTLVADDSIINDAKNRLQKIYAAHPAEVKALDGVSLNEATLKLSQLENDEPADISGSTQYKIAA